MSAKHKNLLQVLGQVIVIPQPQAAKYVTNNEEYRIKGEAHLRNGRLAQRGYNKANGEENFVQAASCFRVAAENNDTDSKYNLGACYYYGIGVTQDFVQAFKLWREASDHNHADAQYAIGHCYAGESRKNPSGRGWIHEGIGVTRDEKQAAHWYAKAAELGHSDAQYTLGCYYASYEPGLERSDVLAFQWCRKAAEQGHALGQYWLGNFYSKTENKEANPHAAAHWFKKSADQGHAKAQYEIALCHLNGNGAAKDIELALTWLHKSAHKGYEEALWILGWHYITGDGVEKSLTTGHAFISLAAERGHYFAIKDMDQVEHSFLYQYWNNSDEDLCGVQKSQVNGEHLVHHIEGLASVLRNEIKAKTAADIAAAEWSNRSLWPVLLDCRFM